MPRDKCHSVRRPTLYNQKMGECRVNFETVCRLCLADEDIVLFSLLTGEVPSRYEYPHTICDKIRILFNINVCADSLPHKICHNCLINVDKYFAFNKVVEATQCRLMVIAGHRDKVKGAAQATETNKDCAGDNIIDEPLLPFRTFRELNRVGPLADSEEPLYPDWVGNSFEKNEDLLRHKGKQGNSKMVKPCPQLQPALHLVDKPQNEVPNNVNMCIKPYMTPPQPKKAAMLPRIVNSVSIKYEDFKKLAKESTFMTSHGPLKDQHSMTGLSVLQSTSCSRNASQVRTSTSTDGSTPQGSPKDISKFVEGMRNSSFNMEEFKCEVCSVLCKHKTILLQHILCHYKHNIYTCHHLVNSCQNKVWFSSSEFKEHLETVHMDNHSFVLAALNQRLKKHARAVMCEICMVVLDSKVNLEEHKRKVHKDYYECKVCKNCFSAKSNLLSHIKKHKLSA